MSCSFAAKILLPYIDCKQINKFAGVSSEGDIPVTIPNTEVKPFSADGTVRLRTGE